jgi:hypothetical protein
MALSITIDDKSLFIICDREEKRPLGTGFCFIKREWVVTAKHVVMDDGVFRQSLSVLPLKERELRASVMFSHPNHDLAVLQLEEPSPCRTPLFPSYEKFTGRKGLICCGYAPSLSNHEKKEVSIYVNQILTYDREQRTRLHVDEDLIAFEAPFLEGGHSGGPILGEGGGVVAVTIQGFVANGKYYGRATSVLPVLDFLDFRTGE